jgi:hypothetical protein
MKVENQRFTRDPDMKLRHEINARIISVMPMRWLELLKEDDRQLDVFSRAIIKALRAQGIINKTTN